jgi:hypothetical protein
MTVSTIFPNVYFLGQKAGESVASLLQSQESPTITDGGNASALFPTLQTLWLLIKSFPLTYKQWWLNLVANDPVHVAVETTLIVSIVYILVSRSNDWKEVQARDKLTDQEQDELVREWKLTGRAPLVPSETNNTTGSSMQQQEEPNDVVVHKIKGRWM